MSEKNTPDLSQNPTDDAPTIIGKEAQDIISAASEHVEPDMEATQKINLVKSKKESQEEPSAESATDDLPDVEDDFAPIFFTREDVVGERPEDEIDPYTEVEEEVKKTPKHTAKKNFQKKLKKVLKRWKKIKKPVSIACAAAAGVFIVLYIICAASLPTDTIAKNVYIEALNVGGLTYDEALASVKATYLFEDQKVTLRCENQTFEFDGLDIGLSASPEETTQKAFSYAKSGNQFSNTLKAMGLLLHRHTVIPVADINHEKLDEKLQQFGMQVYGELVGHYVEVRDNNEATVWPGHTGFDGDVSEAQKDVLNAFSKEQFTNIPVTLKSAPPSDITVEQFDLAVYKDPTDAYYEVSNGQVTVVPEENGRYIDKEKVAPMLATVKEGCDPVIIPWETAYADITAESLQKKLFADVLASYSTYYGNSTANRSANVARASSLLNGAVLGAGEIFSFNDRVGERTTYNGFYTAPEYVNGETVQGIGGGTCQVSTTLYSAVLYAGLDIISRTNHMFTVSYAPLGQDATVADGGLDFQFRNNTEYPIKVSSHTDGSSIYVDIIGTAWDPPRTVKLDHSVSYGSGGTYVYSKRYIYENDECIADEELPSSYYKAH